MVLIALRRARFATSAKSGNNVVKSIHQLVTKILANDKASAAAAGDKPSNAVDFGDSPAEADACAC